MYMRQKGEKINISKQATKQRLKWQKQLKDDISKVITVHLVWGREIKKKRKEKLTAHADVSWKWRQQQSLKKDERKKRIKNYTADRVGEGNYIHLYVHYTGCNHAASLSGPEMVEHDTIRDTHTVLHSQCTASVSTLRLKLPRSSSSSTGPIRIMANRNRPIRDRSSRLG